MTWCAKVSGANVAQESGGELAEMRSLMVIHNFRPNGAGAELQAERLGKKLVGLGCQVEVLTPRLSPEMPLHEVSDGLVIERCRHPLAHGVLENQARTLREYWIRRNRYDLLHVHLAFGHAVSAVLAARWLGKKTIIKLAGAGIGGDLRNFGRMRMAKLGLEIIRQADAFIAVSEEMKAELMAHGFAEERIISIPNAVDTCEFRRIRPRPMGSRMRFIQLGQFYPVKGIDIVLQACRILVEQGSGDRFEVGFYGRENPAYDYPKMAAELGVSAQVEFHPFSDSVLELYNNADCYLLASRSEGLSNALLEAMACELPVIATDVSGVRGVLCSSECGIIIPPEDPVALARAMRSLMDAPEAGCGLGQRARQRVASAFSLSSTSKQYFDLYAQLLSSKSRVLE